MLLRYLTCVLAIVVFACGDPDPVNHVLTTRKHLQTTIERICAGLDGLDSTMATDLGMPVGRRSLERERCFIKGADQENAGMLDFELRGDGEGGHDRYYCAIELGPNRITRPVDLARLLDVVENEKVRKQLVAMLAKIEITALFETTAILEGNIHVIMRQRMSDVHGPDIWIRIDGCARPPTSRVEIPHRIHVYGDAFDGRSTMPQYTGP